MKKAFLALAGAFGLAGAGFSANLEGAEAQKKIEQQSCTPCHSLRLVDSQRLSAAAWAKEVDKMIGWGAIVPDRQKLIDYLASQYSDSKPIPAPVYSGNGVTPRAGAPGPGNE